MFRFLFYTLYGSKNSQGLSQLLIRHIVYSCGEVQEKLRNACYGSVWKIYGGLSPDPLFAA